jgi:hypothetical protein
MYVFMHIFMHARVYLSILTRKPKLHIEDYRLLQCDVGVWWMTWKQNFPRFLQLCTTCTPDDDIFIVAALRPSNLTSSLGGFRSIGYNRCRYSIQRRRQMIIRLTCLPDLTERRRPIPQDCALAKQTNFYKRIALAPLRIIPSQC